MRIRQIALLSIALMLLFPTTQAATYSVVRDFGVLTNISGFEPQSALVQDAAGVLYGVTSLNEGNVTGTVFKVNRDGTGFQVLVRFSTPVNFTNSDGANPIGSLAISGNVLFGTTSAGGAGGAGTVFTVKTDGTGFATLTNFPSARPFLTNSIGAYPYGGLILSGATLYGTAHGGGLNANGTVFSVNTNGAGFTILKTFSATPGGINSDGAEPDGTLVLSGGILYGTTVNGGSSGYGTLFSLNASTTSFAVLHNFTGGSDGGRPSAGLILANGWLFGTAPEGGGEGNGTVFKISIGGSGFTALYDFGGFNDGATPDGGVILAGSTLYGATFFGGVDGFGTVFAVNTNGSGYANLFEFDAAAAGSDPVAGLLLSGDTLYGSTAGVEGQEGVAGGNGTLFAVTTNASGFTNIHTFAYSDAVQPHGGLVAAGGTLYGTTFAGGSGGNGTVFQVNADGSGYSILKNFSEFLYDADDFVSTNSDGGNPEAGLILSGGTLYGTAYYGGAYGSGTVFAVNTNTAVFTNLYDFTGYGDGGGPQGGLASCNGLLYGTTVGGGSQNNGVVFSIAPDGSGFTVVKNFSATVSGTNADGANPEGGLIVSGNMIYGTTYNGGTGKNGTVFSINTSSTAFANLHNFTGGSDGGNPSSTLLLSGNALYGTASYGGISGGGTVFSVSISGTGFTALSSFSSLPGGPNSGATNSNGAYPSAGLALVSGTLYGTTSYGGSNGCGIVFSISTNGGPTFTNLVTLAFASGANPAASLTLSGNALFGTAPNGGSLGDGAIFGLTLYSLPMALNIQQAGANVLLTWTNSFATLQSAPQVYGTYTNISTATSPYTNAINSTQQFFRLAAP